MAINLSNLIVQNYGTTVKNDVIIDEDVNNNVTFDQVYDVAHFKTYFEKSFYAAIRY